MQTIQVSLLYILNLYNDIWKIYHNKTEKLNHIKSDKIIKLGDKATQTTINLFQECKKIKMLS